MYLKLCTSEETLPKKFLPSNIWCRRSDLSKGMGWAMVPVVLEVAIITRRRLPGCQSWRTQGSKCKSADLWKLGWFWKMCHLFDYTLQTKLLYTFRGPLSQGLWAKTVDSEIRSLGGLRRFNRDQKGPFLLFFSVFFSCVYLRFLTVTTVGWVWNSNLVVFWVPFSLMTSRNDSKDTHRCRYIVT